MCLFLNVYDFGHSFMRRSAEMTRAKRQSDVPPITAPTPAPVSRPPCVLVPTAVYLIDQANSELGLGRSTLRREFRKGRLRAAKRAGRLWVLGEWLLEWIRTGEVTRHRRDHAEVEFGRNGSH